MIRILDTFTDTDAVILPNHNPDINLVGGAYIAVAGVWDILDNEAQTTSVAQARATIDSGIYDGLFKVDLKIGDAHNAAYLMFRHKDADEYWYVGLEDTPSGAVRLLEMTAGGAELRAQATFALDIDTFYEIKVICQGDFMKVYVNDVLLITHASESLQTETGIGLLASGNADARFDNLVAEDRLPCLYCTPADVKAHFSVQWTEGAAVDALLVDLIERASRLIDGELHWPNCHYAAADLADQTRYFDTRAGSEMWIPRCISITSLNFYNSVTGAYDITWVQGTDFEVWPYDAGFGLSAFNKIIVKEGAGRSFPTGQRRMEIVGKFGGFHTPPAVIKNACIITASRNYKRGLQQFQATGVVPELGMLTFPMALDADVAEMLRVVARNVPLG